jgi:hypothetical protein
MLTEGGMRAGVIAPALQFAILLEALIGEAERIVTRDAL